MPGNFLSSSLSDPSQTFLEDRQSCKPAPRQLQARAPSKWPERHCGLES